jgi:hypothetical protein
MQTRRVAGVEPASFANTSRASHTDASSATADKVQRAAFPSCRTPHDDRSSATRSAGADPSSRPDHERLLRRGAHRPLHLRQLSRVRTKWLWHKDSDRGSAIQSARRMRFRSRSGLARPNICRFNILILLTVPSTRPELHGVLRPAMTASRSLASPLANEVSLWDACLGGRVDPGVEALCGFDGPVAYESREAVREVPDCR